MEKFQGPPKLFIDPVCCMKVPPSKKLLFTHQSQTYYFCAEGCLTAFAADPEHYLDLKAHKRKGLWGRYLDRLNKSTKGKPLSCH